MLPHLVMKHEGCGRCESLTAAEDDNSNADQLTDSSNGRETDVEKSSSGLADHAVAEALQEPFGPVRFLHVPRKLSGRPCSCCCLL